MADGGPNLGELLDRVADLLVEDASVGDYDDGVEHPRVVLPESDQLVGEPGDGVGLPAAGRMLDEISLPGAVPARIGQESPHHVELVVARPDLLFPLLARLLILGLNDLCVVLQDVGQSVAGNDARPEVLSFEAVRIRRVPGTIVPALVEWQEPRGFALEVRAEPHLVLIHGKVRHRAAELEELFARVAVTLVLFHSVFDRLLGEAVLQLERGDRQAVDEQAEVERPLRLVAAVAKLARDREAVLRVAFSGRRVAGRRCAVEEFDVMRPVLDPIAEHVDDTTLANLALEAGQELAPRRTPFVERQRLGGLRLRGLQECLDLDPIDTELTVVVVGCAADPARSVFAARHFRDVAFSRWIARMTGERRADQPFEAPFAGVSRHVTPRLSSNGDLLQLPRLHLVYRSADIVDLLLDEGPSG